MHRFRFFGALESAGIWRVESSEISHIIKVLRLKEGAVVELCDGQGTVVVGNLARVSSKEVTVSVRDEKTFPKPQKEVHLLMGVLKPTTLEQALPFLTELGVDKVSLFLQAGVDKKRISQKKIERWNQLIRGSVKQCKRSWLPQLDYYSSLESCLEHIDNKLSKVVLDPDADHWIADLDFQKSSGVIGVVGGEKGLDISELEILDKKGFSRVKIGTSTLRAITASIAFVSHCSLEMNLRG